MGIALHSIVLALIALKKGAPKTATDIMGMAAYPFTTSVMGVVLLTFLFIDASKLHLLWIYPVVDIVFMLTFGKRAERAL